MKEVPKEEEFQDWLLHPVTQAVRQVQEMGLQALREQWSSGFFHEPTRPVATAMANASALGDVRATERWMNLTWEQLRDTLEGDDE